MPKYDALRDYLQRRPTTAMSEQMTFAEVEALVGALPPSARTYRPWWANASNVQALGWRAAGWKVDSVNLTAERVTFARDHASSANQPLRPRTAAGPAAVTLAEVDRTEATVQAHIVRYLVAEGWHITRSADTATRERGIDVLAAMNGRILAVEVKGYPGTRYSDPRRAADSKPTAPASQARHWYAQAVLKAMLTRGEHPDYELAIALPRTSTYTSLTARTKGSLDLLAIVVYFVADDGTVLPL